MAFKDLTDKDKKELRDVIDEMTAVSVDSFEKVETAIAYGCPRGQFMSMVHLKTENDDLPLEPLLNDLKKKVEDKLGEGAFDEEEIVLILDSLARNNRDLMHSRKLLSGFKVSPFVVNKIVEIRTRSPLDSGQALFSDLFQIEGIEASAGELVGMDENSSIDHANKSSIEEPVAFFDPEVKKLLTDIMLGIGLGVGAIALLV